MTAAVSGAPAAGPNLTLEFQEELETSDIRKRVMDMKNPQIVLWYFGANGVKQNGITFYRDEFMKMLDYENRPTMWLYDLTAWAALKNSKVPLDKSNRIVDAVEQMHAGIKCIRAAKLFQEMKEMAEPTSSFFKESVVGRESLRNASLAFTDNALTIGEVFQRNCPMLEPIYDLDTSKGYSVLQYLEFFLLLEEMIREKIKTEDHVDVVFALPNDESKYYQEPTFESEIERFLMDRLGSKLEGKSINVHVLCFNYSTDAMHRPYNAPGRVVKKKIDPALVLETSEF